MPSVTAVDTNEGLPCAWARFKGRDGFERGLATAPPERRTRFTTASSRHVTSRGKRSIGFGGARGCAHGLAEKLVRRAPLCPRGRPPHHRIESVDFTGAEEEL